jgi:hypothetical protein
VARHIEELTIDVNGKNTVDRSELDSLRQKRDAVENDHASKSEFMYTSCRDIRETADFIQGKVSEFEVLLLAFADQKAFLVSEIEKLQAELAVENQVEATANIQSDYKQACLDT